MIFLDSSFLFKLYVAEADSDQAFELLESFAGTGVVTLLSDVEVASGGYHGRSEEIVQRARQQYRTERLAGAFHQVTLDDPVFDLARQLGEKHAMQYKLRSLDILHLATALHYGMVGFATYDDRLILAATAFGLKLFPARS